MMTLANICDLVSTQDVFENIEIDNRIDKELLIDRICEVCGNLVSIWADNAGAFIHYSDTFFLRNADNFTRILDAYTAEYNPIENYDRTEDTEENSNGSGSLKRTEGVNNKRSSFDSGTMQNTTSASNTQDDTTSATNKRTANTRIHGNIGITTNQQMISSEISLREFNIYDYITNLYADTLFLKMYF